MRLKKLIVVITALLLIFSLAGCGANQEQPNQEDPQGEAPQQNANLTDGTYVAYSDANAESKGEAKIQFTLKDGKIADAYFKENLTGLSTVEEIDAVDDFAGITHSSEKFKQAAQRALVKANAEKTGTYFDGTFMGYSDTTAEKGFVTAYVTVKSDAIESVTLEEWQPDKEKEDTFVLKDYESYPLKEAKAGNEYFTKEFVGATSAGDIDAVDDFAGVTHSSANYKLAVKMALEKAQQ